MAGQQPPQENIRPGWRAFIAMTTGLMVLLVSTTAALAAPPHAPGQQIKEACGQSFGEIISSSKPGDRSAPRGGARAFSSQASLDEHCPQGTALPPGVRAGAVQNVAGGASLRLRSFGNTAATELLLGAHDLDVAANRSEMHLTWNSPRSYTVEFAVQNGQLSAILDGGSVGALITSRPLGSPGCMPSDWNALEIVAVNDDTGLVRLTDLTVDGVSIASLPASSGTWAVAVSDLGDTFVLRATLSLEGQFSSSAAELAYIQLTAGCD